MNWNKALNLLVIIFIGVNIALGIANYNKYIKAYRLDYEQVSVITGLLEEKGVVLESELPLVYEPLPMINITPLEFTTSMRDTFIKTFLTDNLLDVLITKETTTEGEEIIYRYGDKQIKFVDNRIYYVDNSIEQHTNDVDEKKILEMCKELFNILPLEEKYKDVKIDKKIESYHAEVTYYEVYKEFPLFNSYVKMHVNNNGIYEIEMKLVNDIEVEEGLGTIYPINRVLFELLSSDQFEGLNSPIQISDIEIGYMIPENFKVHLIEESAIPVYKIQINGLEQLIFVNAYTNKLMEE